MCFVSDSPMRGTPRAGSLVGVMSAIDKKMYRAVVKTQTSENSVIVFFLDFGNREEVNFDQIYTLPAKVLKVHYKNQ
jgi:hypothetical protein